MKWWPKRKRETKEKIGMPWHWWYHFRDEEWKFYPGTVEPHLRLRWHSWLPDTSPYLWHLCGTFLTKKQRLQIGNFILSESPWLDGREILEVDREIYE